MPGLRAIILCNLIALVAALPAIQHPLKLAKVSNEDAGPLVYTQDIDDEEADLARDLSAEVTDDDLDTEEVTNLETRAHSESFLRKGTISRFGKYTKFGKFKAFKIGGGRYKSSYYGRHHYRSHYGYHYLPYGYHGGLYHRRHHTPAPDGRKEIPRPGSNSSMVILGIGKHINATDLRSLVEGWMTKKSWWKTALQNTCKGLNQSACFDELVRIYAEEIVQTNAPTDATSPTVSDPVKFVETSARYEEAEQLPDLSDDEKYGWVEVFGPTDFRDEAAVNLAADSIRKDPILGDAALGAAMVLDNDSTVFLPGSCLITVLTSIALLRAAL